jgi:hypothetical protein
VTSWERVASSGIVSNLYSCGAQIEHWPRCQFVLVVFLTYLATSNSFHIALSTSLLTINHVRAVAQVVSRRLPTAAPRVRAQVTSRGICGGQSDTAAGFFQVRRFRLPILIPPTAPHSSSIIRGWYIGPNNGRRTKWTRSRPNQRN